MTLAFICLGGEKMSNEFWIALILSVPMSIIANLLQPFALRAGSRVSTRIEQYLYINEKKRALKLEKFRSNPIVFTNYLIQTCIRVLIIGASISILTAFASISQMIMATSVNPIEYPFAKFIFMSIAAMSQISVIVGSLAMINITRPAFYFLAPDTLKLVNFYYNNSAIFYSRI